MYSSKPVKPRKPLQISSKDEGSKKDFLIMNLKLAKCNLSDKRYEKAIDNAIDVIQVLQKQIAQQDSLFMKQEQKVELLFKELMELQGQSQLLQLQITQLQSSARQDIQQISQQFKGYFDSQAQQFATKIQESQQSVTSIIEQSQLLNSKTSFQLKKLTTKFNSMISESKQIAKEVEHRFSSVNEFHEEAQVKEAWLETQMSEKDEIIQDYQDEICRLKQQYADYDDYIQSIAVQLQEYKDYSDSLMVYIQQNSKEFDAGQKYNKLQEENVKMQQYLKDLQQSSQQYYDQLQISTAERQSLQKEVTVLRIENNRISMQLVPPTQLSGQGSDIQINDANSEEFAVRKNSSFENDQFFKHQFD